MLSSLDFGSFLIWSPRGTSEYAQRSRKLTNAFKYWREDIARAVIERLADNFDDTPLQDFLGDTVTLVPAPRSAPLVEGALWPARNICDELVRVGLGLETLPLLVRTQAIRKAQFSGHNRPKASEHYATIDVNPDLISGDRITVVDDVVTKGTTLIAFASRLADVYPGTDIRGFAITRTMGLVSDIDKTIDSVIGEIALVFDEGDRRP